MADLVQRLGHDGRLRHVRDAAYLAWRLADPQHEYRFLFSGSDRLDGYLVLEWYRLDEDRGVNVRRWEAETAEGAGRCCGPPRLGPLPRAERMGDGAAGGGAPAARRDRLRARRPRAPMRHGVTLLARGIGEGGRATDPTLGARRLLDASAWECGCSIRWPG